MHERLRLALAGVEKDFALKELQTQSGTEALAPVPPEYCARKKLTWHSFENPQNEFAYFFNR